MWNPAGIVDVNRLVTPQSASILSGLQQPDAMGAFKAVLDALNSGQLIVAIKIMRHFTGWGLKETKDFVDMVNSFVSLNAGKQRELDTYRASVRELEKKLYDIEQLSRTRLRETQEYREEYEKAQAKCDKLEQDLKRQSKPRPPGPVHETARDVRLDFAEAFGPFVGSFEALGKTLNDTLARLDKLVSADTKQPFTTQEWRDQVAVQAGMFSGLNSVFNATFDSAKMVEQRVLGGKPEEADFEKMLKEWLTGSSNPVAAVARAVADGYMGPKPTPPTQQKAWPPPPMGPKYPFSKT